MPEHVRKRVSRKAKFPFDDLPFSQSKVIPSTRLGAFLWGLFEAVQFPECLICLTVTVDCDNRILITTTPVDHPESIE